MADSTNINDIPQGVFQLVAYYVDGLYAVPGRTVAARFPNAVLVPISAVGTNAGIVGDVERYDLTPASSVDWVLARRAAGVDPSLYFSRGNIDPIYNAFHSRGVPEPHAWVADWTGAAHLYPTSYATQWADGVMLGTHYDESLVADYWPGVDPLPPPPAPAGAGGSIEGWSGLQVKIDVTIPAFASELGVLSSGLQGLG